MYTSGTLPQKPDTALPPPTPAAAPPPPLPPAKSAAQPSSPPAKSNKSGYGELKYSCKIY